MPKTAILRIGTLVTGHLDRRPLSDCSLIIEDGVIASIERELEPSLEGIDTVIDAGGTTVLPGLLDSHVHIVFGDWTPRQNMVGYIESYMQGGLTTLVSASEVHLPGRPRSPVAVKALAILAAQCFRDYRPNGMKVLAGRIILEEGLREEDFEEAARHGVRMAKGGVAGVNDPEEAARMTFWARKHGMIVLFHTGGASIPGSSTFTAEDMIRIRPNICAHANGGTTALPKEGRELLVRASDCHLELVQCGNLKAALHLLDLVREQGTLERIILGSDSPSGTGLLSMGILKSIAELSSLGDLPPYQAIALATGNTAKVYGLPVGVIEPGRPADLVIADAPQGGVGQDALGAISVGDLPGITAVLIDGEVKLLRSRHTPQARRIARVLKWGAHYAQLKA
jgi:enamidase